MEVPEELTDDMIDAVYISDLNCIRNHDLGIDELKKIWSILLRAHGQRYRFSPANDEHSGYPNGGGLPPAA